MVPLLKDPRTLKEWLKTLDNEIIRSPFAAVDVPDETLCSRLLRVLKSNADKYAHKAAIIDGFNQDRSLTHQQIYDQALSVAAFLRSQGFGIGDRATTVLANCIEFPVIHIGIWAAGGSFVGSKPIFTHYETATQLRDNASSVVFTSENLLESVLRATEECPAVKTVICIRTSDQNLPEGVIDFQDVLETAPLGEVTQVAMNDPCVVLYSSGTTGLPKGIVHTHGVYHHNLEIMRIHFEREVYPMLGLNEDNFYKDFQLLSTATFHLFGFAMLNLWLLTEAPIVIIPRVDEALFPRLVEKYKVRLLWLTPPILTYLSKHPLVTTESLKSVQFIFCGAAPLSKEMSDAFFAKHPNLKYIAQGYALTETSPTNFPVLLREGFDSSSGMLVAGWEQKIVSPDNNTPCKRGKWGEICVRGPGITVGYINNPEATRQLYDEEGFVHTGDIGYIDDFGCIHIVDRVKELIKVAYEHQTVSVSPAEVEGILIASERVRDVAVIGIPQADGSELIRAFVVKNNEDLNEEEVKKIVDEKLSAYKQLTGGVVFVDSIPRSATGKILRRELREKQ